MFDLPLEQFFYGEKQQFNRMYFGYEDGTLSGGEYCVCWAGARVGGGGGGGEGGGGAAVVGAGGLSSSMDPFR